MVEIAKTSWTWLSIEHEEGPPETASNTYNHKKTAIQDQGSQEELIYQCLDASPKTIYLLTGKNDPIFTQHGSELMNEVLLKTASNTTKKTAKQIQFLINNIHAINAGGAVYLQ